MGRLFLIGLAGFVGTIGRYWLSGVVARRYGETFPLGTLVVNLTGCLLIGLLFYLFNERFVVNPTVRSVVLIGLLGGFTTFSSFGLQTFTLLQDGELGTRNSQSNGFEFHWSGPGLGWIHAGQDFMRNDDAHT